MNRYSYNGPVMQFDTCINSKWKASTCAISESKARSNLTYQYKKSNNLVPNAKITLPGKIVLIA